jgi:propanediol dehydratase small subunit
MNQALIEQLVKEVIASMGGEKPQTSSVMTAVKTAEKLSANHDYPIAEKRPELLKSATGKGINEITLQGVLDGTVKPEDVRISPETLEFQAQIADSVGRKPFARNLRRAAELIKVPDERMLEIYNALRPYRSTREELYAIAEELEVKYNAPINAGLVREAADVYKGRDRLRQE